MASAHIICRDLVVYLSRYADAELDLYTYLEERRLEGGASAIDLEDPQNLHPAIEVKGLLPSHALFLTTSRGRVPVNLDHCLDLPPAETHHPSYLSYNRPSSVETEPPIPTEVYESEDYNELVTNGGRPLYPIHRRGCQGSGGALGMLQPWLDYPPDVEPDSDPDSYINCGVFKLQLGSWYVFRRWQVYNRRERRPRYVEIDYTFGALDQAHSIFVWESDVHPQHAQRLVGAS